jgi:hypothetical protein
MQQSTQQQEKQSRLRRLKMLAVTSTAGMGMLIWGAVSGAVAATDAVATSTPQPVTQDASSNSTFFSGQAPAPGLRHTTTAPATRTHGS